MVTETIIKYYHALKYYGVARLFMHDIQLIQSYPKNK